MNHDMNHDMEHMEHMEHMESGDMSKKMEAMKQEMTEDLSGRAGDDFDSAFLHMMLLHHQQAVETSRVALANAQHAEVREMATKVIRDQEEEIAKIRTFQQQWGYA